MGTNAALYDQDLHAWFAEDGCYAIYWYFENPAALEMMHDANFPASLSLYGMCGIIWLYQGGIRQLLSELKHHWSDRF